MAVQNSKLWHLDNIDLLKTISLDERKKLAERTTLRTASKNQFIYFPKEPSKVMFFLTSGRVKIGCYSNNGKEITKRILHPGEVFGEMGIVGEELREDFAMAMDAETRICAIDTEDFREMMNSNSRLSLDVTTSIGKKLKNVEKKFESLIFKDARERIIDFMKEMANKYGRKIGYETLVKHNLIHQDIANLTITSRQTVTTVLNDLKEKDLIYMERKRFLIRDIDSLV